MAENPMAPPGMHLCRFCGSIVPEAQYRKNHLEAARKAGLSVRGSSAAYRRAKKAADARWSQHRQRREKQKSESSNLETPKQ
jgi:hypothetical protein